MKTIGERLKALRRHRKYSQTEAGKLIGITQQSWALIEGGKRKLTGDEAAILARIFDSTVHWLFTGQGAMTGNFNPDIFKNVPVVNISALAGLTEGYTLPESEYLGTVSFPNIENPKNYIATHVSGTSMEPKIKDGSLVVLKRMHQRSEFKDGRIYVIVLHGVPFLKRVKMILSGADKGRFHISSDNEDEVQIVDGEDITQWYKLEYVISQLG